MERIAERVLDGPRSSTGSAHWRRRPSLPATDANRVMVAISHGQTSAPQTLRRPPHGGTLASMLLAYREYRPPVGLKPVVACLWENAPAEDRGQRIVPDGCVDLIWLAERELVIAGADTGPRSVDLAVGSRVSGVRLRPGAAGAILGLPASEVRDRQVALALVWGEQGARLDEALAGAEPARRLELLAEAVRGVAPSLMRLCSPRRGGSSFRRRVSRPSRRRSGLVSASSTDGCSLQSDMGLRCLPGSLACDDSLRSRTSRWYHERSKRATRAKRI
jgi:hypothetical protein